MTDLDRSDDPEGVGDIDVLGDPRYMEMLRAYRTGFGASPGTRRSLSGTLPKTRRSTPTKSRLRITPGAPTPGALR